MFLAGLPQFAAAWLECGLVTLVQDTIITSEALKFTEYWFGSMINPHGDCVEVVNDYIYVVWYKGGMDDRTLHLSRKPVGSGSWVEINLGVKNTLYGKNNPDREGMGDTHRTANIGICPIDQTIHIVFDQHGNTLRYLKSVPGAAVAADANWNSSLFEPERNYLKPGTSYSNVTYPTFTLNDAGVLMLEYRIGSSTSGDWVTNVYNGSTWLDRKLMVAGRNAPDGDFNFYSSRHYSHGNMYYTGTVRTNNFQYNRGIYFAIDNQTASADILYRLGGTGLSTPVSSRAQMDYFKIADPSVGATKHVSSPDIAVTSRGDNHLPPVLLVVDDSY